MQRILYCLWLNRCEFMWNVFPLVCQSISIGFPETHSDVPPYYTGCFHTTLGGSIRWQNLLTLFIHLLNLGCFSQLLLIKYLRELKTKYPRYFLRIWYVTLFMHDFATCFNKCNMIHLFVKVFYWYIIVVKFVYPVSNIPVNSIVKWTKMINFKCITCLIIKLTNAFKIEKQP